MNHLLLCKCSEVIMKGQGNEAKVRGKVITIRDGKVFSVCKGCNTEVEVPLTFDPKVLHSKKIPLFIDNVVDKTRLLK